MCGNRKATPGNSMDKTTEYVIVMCDSTWLCRYRNYQEFHQDGPFLFSTETKYIIDHNDSYHSNR